MYPRAPSSPRETPPPSQPPRAARPRPRPGATLPLPPSSPAAAALRPDVQVFIGPVAGDEQPPDVPAAQQYEGLEVVSRDVARALNVHELLNLPVWRCCDTDCILETVSCGAAENDVLGTHLNHDKFHMLHHPRFRSSPSLFCTGCVLERVAMQRTSPVVVPLFFQTNLAHASGLEFAFFTALYMSVVSRLPSRLSNGLHRRSLLPSKGGLSTSLAFELADPLLCWIALTPEIAQDLPGRLAQLKVPGSCSGCAAQGRGQPWGHPHPKNHTRVRWILHYPVS